MKNIWIILIFGLLLRLILSLITYHSDMEVFNIGGKLVAAGNILNFYDFSSSSAVFNYPPAIYLFHGFFSFTFSILGISGLNFTSLNLALLKMPYIFFDLGVAFLFLRLFDSQKQKTLAFCLWIFNPVNLYATYMMGQFDIIPTFFMVLAIYMAVKNKLEYAALSLGVGIAFKIWPIFLVIPLLVFGKNYSKKIKLLGLSLLPYVISITPYIFSSTFRSNALLASQSGKSLYAAIAVSGGESILLFPAMLVVFYLYIWHIKVNNELWKLFLIPLLLFFIFTHYHPQWLIWVSPLLILAVMVSSFRKSAPFLLIFGSWFSSLFFFESSLTLGLFAPLYGFPENIRPIWQIVNISPDYNFSRSLIQTIFASASLYLIYLCFPKKADA